MIAIKDNELLRQFEISTQNGLSTIEYSVQEKKLFLTKIYPNEKETEETIDLFIENVLNLAIERKVKVVPTHPKIATFFRKNKSYKELLPVGIKI